MMLDRDIQAFDEWRCVDWRRGVICRLGPRGGELAFEEGEAGDWARWMSFSGSLNVTLGVFLTQGVCG